jgi:hypothetical protein
LQEWKNYDHVLPAVTSVRPLGLASAGTAMDGFSPPVL